MLDAEVITPETQTPAADTKEAFSAWRGTRGSAEPATTDKPATPEKPVAAAETPEPAPDSDPVEIQQSKFEKRIAEKQRIVDRLTKEQRDLERSIQQSKTAAPETPVPAAAAPDGLDPKDPKPEKPDQSKFQEWAAFDAAMEDWREKNAEWAARRQFRQLQAKDAQVKQEQQASAAKAKALESFNDRAKVYETEAPDYLEKVQSFKGSPLSAELSAVILAAENGPQIFHELLNDQAEMRRIDALPLVERMDAFYALKYKLLGFGQDKPNDSATEKPRSAAPAPGPRLRGTGSGGSNEPKDFSAYRDKRFAG